MTEVSQHDRDLNPTWDGIGVTLATHIEDVRDLNPTWDGIGFAKNRWRE